MARPVALGGVSDARLMKLLAESGVRGSGLRATLVWVRPSAVAAADAELRTAARAHSADHLRSLAREPRR